MVSTWGIERLQDLICDHSSLQGGPLKPTQGTSLLGQEVVPSDTDGMWLQDAGGGSSSRERKIIYVYIRKTDPKPIKRRSLTFPERTRRNC